MNERSLIRHINKLFPPSSSEAWDFPGFQYGVRHPERTVNKVLLCLDFTEDVLSIDAKKIYLTKEIEKLDCPLYSYHTDYDKGENGMNDTLLSVLKMKRIKVAEDGLMRLASLEKKMTIEELVDDVKGKLNLPFLLYLKGEKSEIEKIALVAGGDSAAYFDALSLGADCYISGDCPHHTRLEMRRYGINYIELPHEVEELGFLKGMKKALETISPSLDISSVVFEKYFDIR